MRNLRKSLGVLALVLAPVVQAAKPPVFTLTSPDIKNGSTLSEQQVLNGFGCTGANVSPTLAWQNPPAGTKSFAVTVYDPDAPTGSGWWHWVMFNIPADTRKLASDAGNPASAKAPAEAVQSLTDFGSPGFGGACPPAGSKAHRYVFTVHALDVEQLDLPATAMPAMVGFMVSQHVLGRAHITTFYKRAATQ